MTQVMIDQYNQHQQRIQLLRSTGDILLQRINILETHMNKRKQQNQYQYPEDINSLNTLVKKLLLMLAEIKTCQYFQLTFEPFSIFSSNYAEMCNRFFENITRQFITDLQFKRYKRLQQLQYQSYQQIINDIFDPVDFEIYQ